MDDRSERNLRGVHPDLVRVFLAASREWSVDGLGVIVTEGVRTHSRQAELVKIGASWTMRGRHITGHAIDVAITVHGEVRWDWPLYRRFAVVMKDVAERMGIALTWGGDWQQGDGPHYELDWNAYPKQEAA